MKEVTDGKIRIVLNRHNLRHKSHLRIVLFERNLYHNWFDCDCIIQTEINLQVFFFNQIE